MNLKRLQQLDLEIGHMVILTQKQEGSEALKSSKSRGY